MVLSSVRNNSLVWLVTGIWCAFFGILSLFSVGIIFVMAAVLLLAAFLNANWGE